MNPQEEAEVIRDICEALDEAERAGTPARELRVLAWHCGVSDWWAPQVDKTNRQKGRYDYASSGISNQG